MFIFEYSRDWADLVTAQLACSFNTCRTREWGYACLLIGRELDLVIANHYWEVHQRSGRYMQVFSLRPPPAAILTQRIQEARCAGKAPQDSQYLMDRLAALASKKPIPDYRQVEEKVSLLRDLANAGLPERQYADFLFFDFRGVQGGVDIDVMAVQSPAVGSEEAALDFFTDMGKKAEQHWRKGDSVKAFVDSLQTSWAVRTSLREAWHLTDYIRGFVASLLKGN